MVCSSCSSLVTNMAAFLPYIIPTCVQRLGQQELVESCEELRLLVLQLLISIIELCKEKMNIYIDDLIKILQRTISDPFHQVKKVDIFLCKCYCKVYINVVISFFLYQESCRCTCLLAKAIPEQFYYQADSLVKPLIQAITHQHSKVRVAVIEVKILIFINPF